MVCLRPYRSCETLNQGLREIPQLTAVVVLHGLQGRGELPFRVPQKYSEQAHGVAVVDRFPSDPAQMVEKHR